MEVHRAWIYEKRIDGHIMCARRSGRIVFIVVIPCIGTTVSSHLDTGGMENIILESECSTATIEVYPKSSCASSVTGIVVELQ